MKKNLVIILFLIASVFAAAEDTGIQGKDTVTLDFGYQANINAEKFFNRISMGFDFTSRFFNAFANLDYLNDDKWSHTESWMGDYYLYLQDGGIDLHAADFSLEGGFLKAREHNIQSPYAVLLNGMEGLDRFNGFGHPSIGIDFEYNGDLIYYNSRWISVNWRSKYTYGYGLDPSTHSGSPLNENWEDKGVNYKMYGVKLGNLMVGYEESSVYLNRNFDANYFFNPAPSILINTLWSQGDNPWVTRDNDGSFMGFFGNYKGDPFYIEGQFLIKDFNMSFISKDIGYPDTLDKFAWSVGGYYDFDFGRLGFWHGGATKYMFAATYQDADNPNPYPYEYTYYPIPVVAGRFIDYYDSYIGYPYGENSLAFAFTYANDFFKKETWEFSLSVQLEYAINGSKSPFNPMGVYYAHSEMFPKIQLFNEDDVLEHTLSCTVTASKKVNDFTFAVQIVLGNVWNRMGLYMNTLMTTNNEPAIYKPISGENKNLCRLSLQVKYGIPVMK